MNNLIKYILAVSLCLTFRAENSRARDYLFHPDKFYYVTGETIHFVIYRSGSGDENNANPFYLQLVRKDDDSSEQRPVSGIKFLFPGQVFSGSLAIGDTLETGDYFILGFDRQHLVRGSPAFVQPVFIYNAFLRKPVPEIPAAIEYFPEGGQVITGFDCRIRYFLSFENAGNLEDTWVTEDDSAILHLPATRSGEFLLTARQGRKYDLFTRFDNSVYHISIPTENTGYSLQPENNGPGFVNVRVTGRSGSRPEQLSLITDPPNLRSMEIGLEAGASLDTVYRIPITNYTGPVRISLSRNNQLYLTRWIYIPSAGEARVSLNDLPGTIATGTSVVLNGSLPVLKNSQDPVIRLSASIVYTSHSGLPNLPLPGRDNPAAWELTYELSRSLTKDHFVTVPAGAKEGDLFFTADSASLASFLSESVPGISGRLIGNDRPVPYQTVYLVGKGKDIYIDGINLNEKGEFKFPDMDLPACHSIDLITRQEAGTAYTYLLYGDVTSSCPFRISGNLRPVPDYRIAFEQYALKNILIENSFWKPEKIKQPDSIPVNYFYGTPVKRIHPEDYISFATLPEVIREIVPMVKIQYRNGSYKTRFRDIRASDYCCTGDPLYFVNDEPCLDNRYVMKIKPDSIDYIDVILPVEAIRRFGVIGSNGILALRLKSHGMEGLNLSGNKRHIDILNPENKEEETRSLPEGYPDFRDRLFWSDSIPVDRDRNFRIEFKTSYLEGDYYILINGITESGEIISHIQKFSVTASR